jgi:hypothetical protein
VAELRRIREPLSGPPPADYWEKKVAEGWRPVAVEWERDDGGGEARPVEVPFGLRVAADCMGLEEHPEEAAALALMLELIAADRPLSGVAAELNHRGLRDRQGGEWSQVAVFEMLPRLIEAAPGIRTPQWIERHRVAGPGR